MSSAKGVVAMHLRDRNLWFAYPWLLAVLPNFAVAWVVCYSIGRTATYYGGEASIFGFMLVAGIITLPQTFPFSLGLGARRVDYFMATSAMFAIACLPSALLLLLLSFVEEATGGWAVGLHFFKLPYVNDAPAVLQMVAYTAVFLHMCFCGLAVSSFHLRFGVARTMALLSGVTLILSIGAVVCTQFGWWDEVFGWLSGQTAFQLALWTLVPTAGYALASLLMLRRATA